MSKLFKLKEWLTLDEAAIHISNVLGEPASVADLYRFAIDGHLIISVNFVNNTSVKKGKWVTTDEVTFFKVEKDYFEKGLPAKSYTTALNNEIRISDNDWVALDRSVVPIGGVWDLAMVGSEVLVLENYYQQLTSGLEVDLSMEEGAFVQQGAVICQLQENYMFSEFQKGSLSHKESVDRFIANNDFTEEDVKKIQNEFSENRREYLKEKESRPKINDYYSAENLPADSVLVVRTKELTRFIQSLEETPVLTKDLASTERNSLLVLIGALCKELGINPETRGVAASIVRMTEISGAPLTDDTIRKILRQIGAAVSLRSK